MNLGEHVQFVVTVKWKYSGVNKYIILVDLESLWEKLVIRDHLAF